MKIPQNVLLLSLIAALLAAGTMGCGSTTVADAAGNDDSSAKPASAASAREHLEQAAASVVLAAKEQVAAAPTANEAVDRARIAMETLSFIGMLGDFDTEPQTSKLLDELQAGARPEVAEAMIQLRLARNLRNWSELDAAARTRAIDRFVADVKQSGLTPGNAELMIRLPDILEGHGDGQLVAKAINDLLPTFRAAKDPQIQRIGTLLEGTARRMPGNKLELEGTLLDGSELDWESYRGKVVLVDFFASWCGPCRAEVPNVVQNYAAYRDKGFEVLGINLDEERAGVESYMQQTGFRFPTLFSDDPSATGWDHPMGRKYGVTAIPRAILVDKNGIIVSAEARGPALGEQLERLLGPASEAGDSVGSARFDASVVPAAADESASPAPAAPEVSAVPEVPAEN